MSKLIELGYCRRPHGIRGEFQWVLHNPTDSILEDKMQVTLLPADESSCLPINGQTFHIKRLRLGAKNIAQLEEITTRDAVEGLIPYKIMLDRDLFPVLDDGEIYLSDLVGLEVRDRDGNSIGEVLGSYDNGAQDVLALKLRGGPLELPLIDDFFPEINIEEAYIVVNLPEMI